MSKSASIAPTKHPVILVGSSAGGLHALQDFFSNIAIESDTTYIVMQHLGAHFESQLSSFIAKVTDIPVRIPKQGEQLQKTASTCSLKDTHLG